MDEAKVALRIGSPVEGGVLKEDPKSVQSSINYVDDCNDAKMVGLPIFLHYFLFLIRSNFMHVLQVILMRFFSS